MEVTKKEKCLSSGIDRQNKRKLFPCDNSISLNNRFFKTLYDNIKGYVEIREFINDNVNQKFMTLSELKKYAIPQNKNIRISIFSRSTKSGKSKFAAETNVIFADYDDIELNEIKNRLDKVGLPEPTIIVDSGHGYHFYWKLLEKAGREVITLYKALARRTGADMQQAGLQAGARLPGSYNLKNEPVKCEILEINNNEYQINFIADILGVDPSQENKRELIPDVNRPCIKSILKGVASGQRNWATGRLTKYLQQQGYTKKEALKVLLEWNERNEPPEKETKLKKDFKAYWKGDYKLLGCVLKNPKLQQQLAEHCNRYNCPIGGKIDKLKLDNSIDYNNRLLQDLRSLSGKALLVYGVLSIYRQGLNSEQLEERANISDHTKKAAVEELDKLGYLKIVKGKKRTDKDFYKLKRQGTFNTGRTIVSNGAINGAIHKNISFKQLKIYILLLKYAMSKKTAYPNLTTLGKEIGVTKYTISKHIRKLEKAGYIEISHDYNKNVITKNYYRLLI